LNPNKRITSLQARIPFPIDIVAWLPDTFDRSEQRRNDLRRLLAHQWKGGGWYALSAADLAQARGYLAGEKERIACEAEYARQAADRKLEQSRQKAAEAQEQAQAAKARENAIDECLQLINRVRLLTEVVRMSLEQERGMARRTWPQQQVTDDCLKLVDCFHGVVSKFDAALSRMAMEIQLARMLKDDATLLLM